MNGLNSETPRLTDLPGDKYPQICQLCVGLSLAEIAAKTGQSKVAVKVMASKLVQQGKLKRKGRGIYGS